MVAITAATARGARPHQEDRLFSEWIDTRFLSGHMLAVFDGHGGPLAAQAVSEMAASRFRAALLEREGKATAALQDTVRQLVHRTQGLSSGSTASIVFLADDGREAFLAVLGDSPIALLDRNGSLVIGPDHNVRTNPKERAAAERRGGQVIGEYLEDPQSPGTGLQMARSLGDKDLGRVLSREPEIQQVPLGAQSVGFVGSDGLLNRLGNPPVDELSRLINLVRQGADAQALVDDALRRQTGDNVSVIVWKEISGCEPART